jgi:hypothetical protein
VDLWDSVQALIAEPYKIGGRKRAQAAAQREQTRTTARINTLDQILG